MKIDKVALLIELLLMFLHSSGQNHWKISLWKISL